MKSCSLAVLACALCATAVSARDIYVSNISGDDRSNGAQTDNTLQMQGPVRTIAKALRLAQPADRIVLEPSDQPYRESVGLSRARLSGAYGERLTIVGNGATLDGSAPVPNDGWEYYLGDVFRFRPELLGHQQLFIDGKPAPRHAATSLDWKVPQLEPKQWCLMDGYLYFCVENGKLPQDYQLTYSSLPVGITLYHVWDVAIFDLTVQGFQLDGINAHDGASNALISGVTCRGNGRSGISVGGSSRVRLEESLLGDNGTAQLRTEGYSHTTVVKTELLPASAPGFVQRGGQLTIDGETPLTVEPPTQTK